MMTEQKSIKIVGVANGFIVTKRLGGHKVTYYMAVRGSLVYTNKNRNKLIKQCKRVQ